MSSYTQMSDFLPLCATLFLTGIVYLVKARYIDVIVP